MNPYIPNPPLIREEPKSVVYANPKSVDRVFMVLFGIIGLTLFIISSNSFELITNECKNKTLKSGLLVIMVISAILVTIAISYTLCNWNGVCYQKPKPEPTRALLLQREVKENKSVPNSSSFYLYFTFAISCALSITLLIVGATLDKACTGHFPGSTKKDRDNGKKLKFNIWFMFAMCILCTLLSGGSMYYNKFGFNWIFSKKAKK